MKKKILVLLIIISGFNVAIGQDCCDYEDNIVDTSSVIANRRLRFQYLTTLKVSDFDYIYTREYDTGCNESDRVTDEIRYLNKQIALRSKIVEGSGEGGYLANSERTEYYENDLLIFVFEMHTSFQMNTNKSYLEETRSYYDACGRIVRKLIKNVDSSDYPDNVDLKEILRKVKNKDITPK